MAKKKTRPTERAGFDCNRNWPMSVSRLARSGGSESDIVIDPERFEA